jgi:hypothetical protein
MLRWYGDVRAATEQWPNLLLYMEYLEKLPTVNTTGLLTYNIYNDWDRPVDKTARSTAPPAAGADGAGPVPDPKKGPRGEWVPSAASAASVLDPYSV